MCKGLSRDGCSRSIQVSRKSSKHREPWLQEYLYGATQEIYRTPLSAGFKGMRFEEVST